MDWATVRSRIAGLPATYRRNDPTYAAWEASLTQGLALSTTAIDALMTMLSFPQARARWLDLWGQLFGVVRNLDEADTAYLMRITTTLTAWRGTVPALEKFILETQGQLITVTEYLPTPGYQVGIPAALANLPVIASDLNFVRPAGVPYTFGVVRGGLYLGTINYVRRPRVTGSYLTEPITTVNPSIPPSTNNALPTVPTTFLSDPTINPSL